MHATFFRLDPLQQIHDDLLRAFTTGGMRDARRWHADAALPVNVWLREDGATLTAQLPGVEAGSLDVSVLGKSVTLRGRFAAPAEEPKTALLRERPMGEFTRTLQLPFRLDAGTVAARYHAGVLELTLPRAAEDRPRRITVQAA